MSKGPVTSQSPLKWVEALNSGSVIFRRILSISGVISQAKAVGSMSTEVIFILTLGTSQSGQGVWTFLGSLL